MYVVDDFYLHETGKRKDLFIALTLLIKPVLDHSIDTTGTRIFVS